MTPRSGFKVALIGLLVTLLCGLGMATVVLFAGGNTDMGKGWIGLVSTGIIMLMVLGATLGHIAMLAGLIIAGVAALTNRSGKTP
jgi:hypothetical protein